MKFKCCICGKEFRKSPGMLKDINRPHCSISCGAKDDVVHEHRFVKLNENKRKR